MFHARKCNRLFYRKIQHMFKEDEVAILIRRLTISKCLLAIMVKLKYFTVSLYTACGYFIDQ